MIKLLTLFIVLFVAISCSSLPTPKLENQESNEDIITHAVSESSPAGKKILMASQSMVANEDIIIGSCWDYINTVYNRAGFSTKQRETIYSSNKNRGPYLDLQQLVAGDWIYYVNHNYNNIEHSAIFVGWANKKMNEALMVSYVGERHKKPAEFKRYIINQIYNVIRPRD
jgi:hypothetical protein